MAGLHLSRLIGIGIVIGVQVPAVGGNFGNCVHAICQHLPERRFVMRAARQSHPYSDNGNGLSLAAFRFIQPRTQFAQL